MRAYRQEKHIIRRAADRLGKVGVMVLDSSPAAGKMYKSVLERLGFRNIHLVSDAFQSVQLLKKIHISLMLTDVELKLHLHQPDPIDSGVLRETVVPMSGISLVQRLRRSPISPNPFLPIIMLLDDGHMEQAPPARDAGVTEVMCKPVRVDELCGRIINIVDHPRIFVTAPTYMGPCRRNQDKPLPDGMGDKRKKAVCLIRHNDNRAEG